MFLLVVARCGRGARSGGDGRRVGARVAVAAAVLAALSVVVMATLVSPADPTRVHTGTDTRSFSLLLGALVATGPARAALARGVGRRAGAVAAALVGALAVVWTLADGLTSTWLYTGGLFAHALAAALLVGLCAQAPHTTVATVLAWRPLRWLGLVSYSLYLWHWPVIVLLTPQRTHLGGWPLTLVVCAVSIGVAALSRYLVEDAVRFRARWARGRSGVAAFVALMAGLAVLWLALPEPTPPPVDLTELG